MKSKSRKAIFRSAVAIAGVGAVGATASYMTADYLMRLAMDREMPLVKNMEKASARLQGSSGEKSKSLRRAQAEARKKLEGVRHQTVEIVSYDGERLVGHWYPAQEPRRIIIAMHGWRSSWKNDFGLVAPFWYQEGCSVLYAEQRGQNHSGGDYMGFGMLERHDCLEWVRWAEAQNQAGLPIYLAGVSMGASTVLMATGLDLPHSVHGVIADCGYTSPYAIWKHVMDHNLRLSYGAIGRAADRICRQKLRLGPKDCSTTEALGKNKTPVLFIHGTDDHFVPVEMTYENYKACAAPKRLLIVPGADHAMSYATDQTSYETALRAFWNDFDP